MSSIFLWTFQRFYLLWEHLPGVFGNSLFMSLSLRTHCPYLCVPSHCGPVTALPSWPHRNPHKHKHEQTNNRKSQSLTRDLGFDLGLMRREAQINAGRFSNPSTPGPLRTSTFSGRRTTTCHWILRPKEKVPMKTVKDVCYGLSRLKRDTSDLLAMCLWGGRVCQTTRIISEAIKWITLKCDIHGPQRMNCFNFYSPWLHNSCHHQLNYC